MIDNATMTIPELAKAIITLADEKSVMLVLAESCTGGMIAAALTDIAGSSAVLLRFFCGSFAVLLRFFRVFLLRLVCGSFSL